MFQEKLKQTLWQIPLLIITASLMAGGVNHWRSDGIALVGDWSPEARFADAAGDSLIIDMAEASHLFREKAVVFVDARPKSQYLEGHIRGALNLPWQEVDQYFTEMADRIDGSEMIVTYCDGESCDLSHALALFLQEMGFANVRVLVNGWTVWQQAGLPTDKQGYRHERGTDPGGLQPRRKRMRVP
jgi:3-mercaptopyruvate sulfurtransferase SseA